MLFYAWLEANRCSFIFIYFANSKVAIQKASNMTVGNWAKQLKVQQLKQLLRARSITEERGCVERSELEALAVANFGSMDEAQTILAQQEYPTKKKDQLPSDDTMEKLKRVLGEDRGS